MTVSPSETVSSTPADQRTWQVELPGVAHPVRLCVHHLGGLQEHIVGEVAEGACDECVIEARVGRWNFLGTGNRERRTRMAQLAEDDPIGALPELLRAAANACAALEREQPAGTFWAYLSLKTALDAARGVRAS